MSAVYVSNLTINTGTNFSQSFNLASSSGNSALDLTGYSVESKLAKHAGASESNKTSFSVSILDQSGGVISIGLTSGQTSNLNEGRYIYDLVITSSTGIKTRVIEGTALVRKGVT